MRTSTWPKSSYSGVTVTLGPSEFAQIFKRQGWLLLVPTIFKYKGSVIYPNLQVVKVISSSFDSLSFITPKSGTTEYLASTFDS